MIQNVFHGTPDHQGDLVWEMSAKELGLSPQAIWNSSPSVTNFTGYYGLPHLVTQGTTFVMQESASRFSPPPFAVAIRGENGERVLLTVAADAGHHLFATVEYLAEATGVKVKVELEGHSDPTLEKEHIWLEMTEAQPEESEMALLERGLAHAYPQASHPRKSYDWWKLPIYCAAGSCIASAFHLAGKPGGEAQHMLLESEWVIQHQLDLLDEAEVPWKTLVIDCGWSPGGVWTKPYPGRWPDLKDFIARQHAKGHKVLLWLGLWFTGGLPDKWCIKARPGATMQKWNPLSGKDVFSRLEEPERFWADAGNEEYLAFVAQQVRTLVSPEGFDADGFKLDMLQQTPCERFAQGREHWDEPLKLLKGEHEKATCSNGKWGCELLHDLQKTIYDAAKSVKPDALINSSTVHPYFADTFDMMRLHDTCRIEADTDVFALMSQRAALAKAALPMHEVDADNWIHSYYEKWMDYTLNSWKLGTPCLFYTDRFLMSFTEAPGTCPIPREDLQKLGKNWRDVFALK